MLTSSNELQAVIDGKTDLAGEHVLAPGDYHIRGNDAYRTLHLYSTDPYAHRIFVHETPLKIGGNSRLRDLTFHAAADIPILLLDHSSRARVYDNFFNAPTVWDGNGPIETFERTGYGVVTTEDSISENNWNVRITGNEFRWFKAGIDVRMPGESPIGNRVKGTAKWHIFNNGFDACEVGVRLVRPILFNIGWNHFQLHRIGIQIEGGKTNWIENNDFERGYGEHDMVYDADTCHTLAVGNTAPPPRINAHVKDAKHRNLYARPLRKRNIWRACDEGDDR